MARISLDQYKALIAVVDAGGYAQAAELLHKSQSAVSYAVQKMERLLGVALFRLEGRRAVLTEAGAVLYRQALHLVEDAEQLEHRIQRLAAGVETRLRLAVETLFPTWLLLQCLDQFSQQYPQVRVDLDEAVLGGTDEALIEARAELVVCTAIPQGCAGEPLMRVTMIPAAHPGHPLHQLQRPLTLKDLRKHRQLVVRDTALARKRDSGGWLGAEQRWTVSNKATSIEAARMGLGFAWYAEDTIRRELEAGQLKQLPLRDGGQRFATLYLVVAEPDFAGPATLHLAQLMREQVSAACSARPRTQG